MITPDNHNYAICSTYPDKLIVPRCTTRADLLHSATLREDRKVIAFCFQHPISQGFSYPLLILRCLILTSLVTTRSSISGRSATLESSNHKTRQRFKQKADRWVPKAKKDDRGWGCERSAILPRRHVEANTPDAPTLASPSNHEPRQAAG